MRFVLAGRDLRDYGSQGEQRTAILALVLAERAWRAREGGAIPLLLLDDVMSELDESRRRALMGLLSGEGQTVLTTTDLHYFSPEELSRMTVVELGAGGASGGDAARDDDAPAGRSTSPGDGAGPGGGAA